MILARNAGPVVTHREEDTLTGTTRASFYVYNTEEEIDLLVASLRRIVKFFGGT